MRKITPEQKHKNMSHIKNKDSDIEIILRKALWEKGCRYRKNVRSVYGCPDICFKGLKIAVFCDSEFWHGYDWENRKNDFHTNRDFWIPKIERNIARDKEVNTKLEEDGWIVLRFFGKEIKKETDKCVQQVLDAIEQRKGEKTNG